MRARGHIQVIAADLTEIGMFQPDRFAAYNRNASAGSQAVAALGRLARRSKTPPALVPGVFTGRDRGGFGVRFSGSGGMCPLAWAPSSAAAMTANRRTGGAVAAYVGG